MMRGTAIHTVPPFYADGVVKRDLIAHFCIVFPLLEYYIP